MISHALALEADLRRRVRGEVRFDDGSRALYATDASNYRQVPIGVVVPRTPEDVVEAVAAAREHGAPLTMRGGGTSLAGQCCNVALIVDSSKYLNRVIELDPARRFARVQPGCVLDDLRARAYPHGLTFAPDPSTHTHCTLGGMIGNNSCGLHSVVAGDTIALGYPDVYTACDHITEAMEARPIGCEGMDDVLVGDMVRMHIHPEDTKLLPDGKGWLLVEFGGDSKEEADEKARALVARIGGNPSHKLFDEPEEEKKLWRVREAGLGATARLADGTETWEGWEDSSVPPERLGRDLRDPPALLDRLRYQCAPFRHLGHGCLPNPHRFRP